MFLPSSPSQSTQQVLVLLVIASIFCACGHELNEVERYEVPLLPGDEHRVDNTVEEPPVPYEPPLVETLMPFEESPVTIGLNDPIPVAFVPNDRVDTYNVTVHARFLETDGRRRLEFACPDQRGRSSCDLTPERLALSTDAVEVSQYLRLSGRTSIPSTGEHWTWVAQIYFHPVADGWVMYGEELWKDTYSRGALSERAREYQRTKAAKFGRPGNDFDMDPTTELHHQF